MKKNVIAMSIISVITFFFLSFDASDAVKKTNEKVFSGRVIFVSDTYVELKRGKTEVLVYFTDSTKYITKDGSEGTKDILTVCQYIKAYYTDGTKKFLNKIIIKKESDCVK